MKHFIEPSNISTIESWEIAYVSDIAEYGFGFDFPDA